MFRQAISRSSGAFYVGGGVLIGAVGSAVSKDLMGIGTREAF